MYDLKQLDALSAGPGVYLMKDAQGRVLYVGKARNLRGRLRNYFSGADERLSVAFLLKRVEAIATIVTQNEKEAFLLENTLIKKHLPRYNVSLRDDKNFLSIRIDPASDWPRIELVRRRKSDGALYFGPYSSSGGIRRTIRALLRLFPLRSCKDSVFYNRERPCILHELKKCCAPCVLDVPRGEYAELVRQVTLFLKGRREELTRALQRQMAEFAAKLEYENALACREKLRAVQVSREQQLVALQHDHDSDVIAVATDAGFHLVAVVHYRGGALVEAEGLKFRDVGQDWESLSAEFLREYYSQGRPVPPRIYLSARPEGAAPLLDLLRAERGGAVQLHVPERGRFREALELAQRNAAAQLRRVLERESGLEQALEALRDKLELPGAPRIIECADVSNIQGAFAVGAVVRFNEGKPEKREYRRYKIRTVAGADDFAMLREMLTRRYGRLLREEQPLPDLLIVDGGAGQLNAARQALGELALDDLPLAGLAKSRLKETSGAPSKRNAQPWGAKRRTEERLFLPERNNPVVFAAGSPELHLIQRIRDEAHRFAITYHKQLRGKANLQSALEQVPGVGKTRRRNLLRHFGSLAQIRQAGLAELEGAGIPKNVAAAVYAFFRPRQTDEDGGSIGLEVRNGTAAAEGSQ